MENNISGHSAYNLNTGDFLLFSDLQKSGINLRNRGDYMGSFDRWVSIRIMIGARFTEQENTELDELENKFYGPLKIKIPSHLSDEPRFGRKSERQEWIQSKNKFERIRLLDNYVKKLRYFFRIYKISMTDIQKKAILD